mgnify:CR=1 FL=1
MSEGNSESNLPSLNQVPREPTEEQKSREIWSLGGQINIEFKTHYLYAKAHAKKSFGVDSLTSAKCAHFSIRQSRFQVEKLKFSISKLCTFVKSDPKDLKTFFCMDFLLYQSEIFPRIQKAYLEKRAIILKLFKIKNPIFSILFSEFW